MVTGTKVISMIHGWFRFLHDESIFKYDTLMNRIMKQIYEKAENVLNEVLRKHGLQQVARFEEFCEEKCLSIDDSCYDSCCDEMFEKYEPKFDNAVQEYLTELHSYINGIQHMLQNDYDLVWDFDLLRDDKYDYSYATVVAIRDKIKPELLYVLHIETRVVNPACSIECYNIYRTGVFILEKPVPLETLRQIVSNLLLPLPHSDEEKKIKVPEMEVIQ